MQPNASTSSSKLPSPLLTVTNMPQPIRMPGADFSLSLERSMQNPQRTSQQADRPSQTESSQNPNLRQVERQNASAQKDQTRSNSEASEPSSPASKQADETPANREGKTDSEQAANTAANAAGDETGQPANIAAVAHLVAGNLPVNLSLAKGAPDADIPTDADAPTEKLNNPKLTELGFSENADPKARTKTNSVLTMASTARTGTNASVSNAASAAISADGTQALQTAKVDASLSQSTLQTGASHLTIGAQHAFTARSETPTVMQVSTPVGQKVWSDDIANRVMWLAGRGEGRAELILTPPNLGKLGVTIQMNGDQATAHFVTASNSAREALENAMPRLREALQQAGIAMGDTSVSTSSQQQQSSDDGYRSTSTQSRADDNEYGMLPELSSEQQNGHFVQVGTGLVDIFA